MQSLFGRFWYSDIETQSSRGMPATSWSTTVQPPPIRLSYHNSEHFKLLRCWLRSVLIHKNETELQGPKIANTWPSKRDKLRKPALSSPHSEGYKGWALALLSHVLEGSAKAARIVSLHFISKTFCQTSNYVVSLGKWWGIADSWYNWRTRSRRLR